MPVNQASEYQEQIALIKWISLQHPWLINHTIYIMNERKTSLHAGALMNKMGRLKGASDLFFAYPTLRYFGLWIEMKSLKGRATPEQLAFIERMNKFGYYACVCKGAEAAMTVINDYLSNKI